MTAQVVSFAGDLLSAAEGLLRDGLHTSEVAEGYGKAAAKVHPGHQHDKLKRWCMISTAEGKIGIGQFVDRSQT